MNNSVLKGKNPLIPKPFLIIDLDDTLFPTTKYLANVSQELSSLTNNIDFFMLAYNQYRKEHQGFVDLQAICTLAQKEAARQGWKNIDYYSRFVNHDLTQYQTELENNRAFLKALDENKIPYQVITQGNVEFQKMKLKQSGLQEIIGSRLLITEENKLPFLIEALREKISEHYCIVLDDKATVLKEVLNQLSSLSQKPEGQTIKDLLFGKTCLVKIGPWSETDRRAFPINPNFMDFQFAKPGDILTYLISRPSLPEGQLAPLERISPK